MNVTAEVELDVRRSLADDIGGITDAGYVIPAPIYFSDRGDFWNMADPKTTKVAIETAQIAATWIYPLLLAEDPDEGSDHSPLLNLAYEFYIFRGYAFTREDETEPQDDFGKKVLVQHNLFMKSVLNIRNAFLGKRNLAGFDPGQPGSDWAIARTTSVTVPQFLERRGACEFIPQLQGFAARLRETVQLMPVEC